MSYGPNCSQVRQSFDDFSTFEDANIRLTRVFHSLLHENLSSLKVNNNDTNNYNWL